MRSEFLGTLAVGALLVAGNPASAEIFGMTGDLDVGPAQDFIARSIVCRSASTLFKMYEGIPQGADYETRRAYLLKFYTPHINSGACGAVPASTAYVIGIRTAMIRKGESPPSKYVVARVLINGERLYVTPEGLQQTGFEIIKAAQAENKKLGAPLVQ